MNPCPSRRRSQAGPEQQSLASGPWRRGDQRGPLNWDPAGVPKPLSVPLRPSDPPSHWTRSSPCPNVKHGDEWGDPGKCENGDACQYCHTRTEQQFHPEVGPGRGRGGARRGRGLPGLGGRLIVLSGKRGKGREGLSRCWQSPPPPPRHPGRGVRSHKTPNEQCLKGAPHLDLASCCVLSPCSPSSPVLPACFP